MGEEKIEKNNSKGLIKNALMLYFGTIIFVVIVMLIFGGEIFWDTLLLIFIFATIIFGVMLLSAWFIKRKNPNVLNKANSDENQKKWRMATILFGIFLIISGIYTYLNNPHDSNSWKYLLFQIVFGTLSILWGMYYKRNKIKLQKDL